MRKIQNQNGWLVIGVLAITTLSSCSRGYGCPYDFSILDTVLSIGIKAVNVLTFLI